VVEVVEGLDLRTMSRSYRGSGSASYHPTVLLSILVYGYATGVFSSRKLERATYDSVAFRFIAGNEHPDHHLLLRAHLRGARHEGGGFYAHRTPAGRFYCMRRGGEWSLVTMAWNMKRMFALCPTA
jgi:Transposase domain (DUF772)